MKKHFEKAVTATAYADYDADSSGYVSSAAGALGDVKESEAEGRIRDIGKADLVKVKGHPAIRFIG